MPFGLGHALSRKAIQGGKATNDQSDVPKIAVLLRGGRLPQASVYPAALRATRALWRRRMPLRRKRAELLSQVHNTKSPENLPESGKKIASKANRDGVAERLPAPAVHKSQRFPRVQALGSYCRLVKGAKASAGQREGTSGQNMGHASRKGALAEAAVLGLRNHEAGQPYRARLEKHHGTGKALLLGRRDVASGALPSLRQWRPRLTTGVGQPPQVGPCTWQSSQPRQPTADRARLWKAEKKQENRSQGEFVS
jgi:transposase